MKMVSSTCSEQIVEREQLFLSFSSSSTRTVLDYNSKTCFVKIYEQQLITGSIDTIGRLV